MKTSGQFPREPCGPDGVLIEFGELSPGVRLPPIGARIRVTCDPGRGKSGIYEVRKLKGRVVYCLFIAEETDAS